MENYDIVVIGAGPGGYPAAIRAAQLGVSVAIVAREELGGTCLNWGCIPTKLFIDSAKLCHSVCKAESIGIRAGSLTLDYPALASHKDRTAAKLHGGVGQLLKANGVKAFRGTASFQSSDRIGVTSPGVPPIELGAGKFIIATGSTSSLPTTLPKHESILESRAFPGADATSWKTACVGWWLHRM